MSRLSLLLVAAGFAPENFLAGKKGPGHRIGVSSSCLARRVDWYGGGWTRLRRKSCRLPMMSEEKKRPELREGKGHFRQARGGREADVAKSLKVARERLLLSRVTVWKGGPSGLPGRRK